MRQRLDRLRGQKLPLALVSALFVLSFSSFGYAQALGPLFGIDEEADAERDIVQYLPTGFFDTFPTASAEDIAVEADNLVFDADQNRLIASGGVQLSYQGYLASGDRAIYERNSGDLVLIGNAVIRDPTGVIYKGDRVEVTGDFKRAFLIAMAMQTSDGAIITADEAEYRDQMIALLKNGSYAPCGLCVDDNGNQIGWRVRATNVVLNREEKTLYLEKPTLELLGFPLVSLPFYWMPDPTDPRSPGFRFPTVDYSGKFGARLSLPYFYGLGDDTDFWLTPMLMSRQGLLLDGELSQKFDPGEASLRAAGLYQLDRSAFAGNVGDRDWRGAIQTSGTFTPIENWKAGWSFLAFSDPGFINDYDLSGFDRINDVYVQHLSDTVFFDARVQEFLQLGEKTATDQNEQGATVPVIRFDAVQELENDLGQIAYSGNLLGVTRGVDHTGIVNGVPYVYGFAGSKYHATIEAMWSRQWIAPGGLVATPYLGLRADAAGYDGTSALLPASTLFAATPIAAIDVRFPLIALDGNTSFLFEPIAQLVYRGSNTSAVGITNDNAQSFVFEDSNLFSFNRFSGSDRQETGLRANIGGQFMANFEDGTWLRIIGGQSFQLAGSNAFGQVDEVQVGNMSGLENTASYIVAGASASLGSGVEVGGKLEVDPASVSVVRGAVALQVDVMRFTLNTDYYYQAARPALGELGATHTIDVDVGVPFADYWTASSGVGWDLVANNWSQISIGVGYDDEYLAYGASFTAKQDVNTLAIEQIFGIDFALNGPSGN